MDFLTQNQPLIWLCVVVLFSFLELFLLTYRVLWFSVGSTVGLIVSLLSGPVWLQIVLFVLVSVGLLLLSNPWVKQVRCEDVLFEFVSDEETVVDPPLPRKGEKDSEEAITETEIFPATSSVLSLSDGMETAAFFPEKFQVTSWIE